MGEDDPCAAIEIPIEDAIDHEEWSRFLKLRPIYIPTNEGATASELFFIRLQPGYFDTRRECQVYGSVTLYDQDDTPYQIYCRQSDEPECLTPQNNLLCLDLPTDCLISTPWSRISYSLFDKADNHRNVQSQVLLPKLTDINQYHKLQQESDKNVFLSYAAFPAALVAVVEISLTRRNDSAPLNLYGKVVTYYGNTYGHKYPGVVILNAPPNEPIVVPSDGPIELELYREELVVPAYSFLRIDLRLAPQPHLQEGEDIISCKADILAKRSIIERCEFEAKNFTVRFKVNWYHPYEALDNSNDTTQPSKRVKVKVSPTLVEQDVISITRQPCLPMQCYSLVEVYSVMIHPDDNDSELKIRGSVKVYDSLSSFTLFDNTTEQDPIIVDRENGNTIPINVRSRNFDMSMRYFGMGFAFKDDKDRLWINGDVSWDERNIERDFYDKRICTVIRGVHGYAALFYTIFSNAFQAEVSVLFEYDGCLNNNASHCVNGTVVASQSNERYSTVLDRKYYQSVLFRNNTSKSALLNSGDKLPLLKSVIAVPVGASLFIDVDLNAQPISSCELQERLKLELEVSFQAGSGTHLIKNTHYSVKVTVEWSDLKKLFSDEWEKRFGISKMVL